MNTTPELDEQNFPFVKTVALRQQDSK